MEGTDFITKKHVSLNTTQFNFHPGELSYDWNIGFKLRRCSSNLIYEPITLPQNGNRSTVLEETRDAERWHIS